MSADREAEVEALAEVKPTDEQLAPWIAWFEEHLTWDTFTNCDSEDFARAVLASGLVTQAEPEHNHTAKGTHQGCDACRRLVLDSNALAEIAAKAMEANGIEFANLSLRYGVADAVLASSWFRERIGADRA